MRSNQEPYDFSDLEIIEIPVTGPDKKKYILREASGDAVARFNNARAQCVKFTEGGGHTVRGPGHLEIFLLTLCLFQTDEDGNAILTSSVKEGTLKPWPDRVLSKLFDKAKEISELDQEDSDLESLKKQRDNLNVEIEKLESEETLKNESSPTETGSY